MFDDRITVESPGSLPRIVRLNNLRTVHFSRNPKIAEFLHQYEYVKEFGEGVDRMFNEMENAGLPDPEYTDNAFMLNVTIRNGVINEVIKDNNEAINEVIKSTLNTNEQTVLELISDNPKITKPEMKEKTGLSMSTVERAIKSLKEKGIIERVGSNKTGYWKIN